MPDIPPSPEHRARWRRARHIKTRILVIKHLVNLATMVAVALTIGVIYRMVSVYAARQGYTRADMGRVGVALFLAGGLVGGGVVYVAMAGRRR
jgi:hypothetical protein